MNNFSSSDIINIINCDRLENGVPPLVENKQLDQAAQIHFRDMLNFQYYSHVNPINLHNPLYFQLQSKFNSGWWGENINEGYFKNLQVLNTSWMNSPDHKANILNPVYKYTGVYIDQGSIKGQYNGEQTTIAIQEFASVKGDNTKPTVTPKQTQYCQNLLTESTVGSAPVQTVNIEQIGFIFMMGVLITLLIIGIILLLTRLIRTKLSIINIGWIKRKSSNVSVSSGS